VITSLEISGLRGIREGRLDGLAPLTILVGPNGCGKSTVLDALLVVAGENPQNGIELVKNRHTGLQNSASRWLLWEGNGNTELLITARRQDGESRTCAARLLAHGDVHVEVKEAGESSSGRALRAIDLDSTQPPTEKGPSAAVHILEGLSERKDRPLHMLLKNAYQSDRRDKRVVQQMRELVPSMEDVLIFTEDYNHNEPVVYLTFANRIVPVTLAGDGIHAFLRLSLELASLDARLVLLEEPEVHQHPAAIRQAARAIVNAVRDGIQVVLTTHSLELIDAFLAESSSEDVERLSLFKLDLHEGKLISVRVPGSDVAFARGQIEEDLR